MNVYRLCRKDEIDKILTDKSFKRVGECFQTEPKKNNFQYAEGVKYLHFFKDESSLLYLSTLKGRFICGYDIPDEILAEHKGVGQYRNFINFNSLVSVAEYAVESDLIKFEYLKKVDKIIVDIDYEDYFFDPSLKGFRENIYNQTNNLKEIGTEREL